MDIGDLKERVEIEELSVATNDRTGEQVPTWTSIGTVWAMKKPRSGDEKEKDDVYSQTQKINFIIRYNADMDNNAVNYRLIYKTKTLNIISAEEVIGEGWKMWMELKCELKSNQ